MAKDWVQKLAQNIKHGEHRAAEEAARQQRHHIVLATKGRVFYDEMLTAIRTDITELNDALKGDVTDVGITLQNQSQQMHLINRPNFPRVNATLQYLNDKISVQYATAQGKSKGVQYVFQVGENEGVLVRETPEGVPARELSAEKAKQFNLPMDLAKHVVELLFAVPTKA
jgi:hypothetical protein